MVRQQSFPATDCCDGKKVTTGSLGLTTSFKHSAAAAGQTQRPFVDFLFPVLLVIIICIDMSAHNRKPYEGDC